jgi:hypothetical protein
MKWLGCDLSTLLYDAPARASYCFLSGVERQLSALEMTTGTARKYVNSFRRLIQGSPLITTLDVELLVDYAKALGNDGANLPHTWAIPMPREVLHRLILDPALPIDLRAGLFLAWKTASRWDDVRGLRLPLQYYPEARHLLVRFLDNTKTSKEDPFAGRFLAVVDWSEAGGLASSAEILHHLTSPGTLGMDWTSDHLNGILGKIPVPSSALNPPPPDGIQYRDHFTCHSVKRGADRYLWIHGFMDNYDNPGKRLDPEIVERICKHQNPRGERLSSTTLRYAPDPYVAALALGTQLASRIL